MWQVYIPTCWIAYVEEKSICVWNFDCLTLYSKISWSKAFFYLFDLVKQNECQSNGVLIISVEFSSKLVKSFRFRSMYIQ